MLSDILRSMGLSAVLFGRLELGAPWAVRIPQRPLFGFYVVARGSAWLTMEGERQPLTLSAGDVALLPGGGAHQLRDPSGRRVAARETVFRDCTGAATPGISHFGGDGPQTELVGGAFRFAEPKVHPLLAALPPRLHLRADDPAASSWLAGTVQLLMAESGSPRPGGALVLERLTEVLLVQALRLHAAAAAAGGGCSAGALRALADPAIGTAMERMHAAPGVDWTVETLARAVGLSRSGFAARFRTQVGEPPLQYLARWRMTKAAEQLRNGRDSIATIAERFGYDSEAAFHRSFKRWEGLAPGAYRRSRQSRADAAT